MPLKGKVLAAELYCNHNTLCFEDVIVYDACRSPVITGLLLAQNGTLQILRLLFGDRQCRMQSVWGSEYIY